MRGGSQKVTNDDEGEGGVTIPPKIDDVIYEQPLMITIGADHGSKKAEAINLIEKRILRVWKIWIPKS